MSLNPSKHRILLVGPRVVHLKPFFERRRYKCLAVQKGVEGMTALDAEPYDIVILELNLGDLTATEFLMAARQAHQQASFLLLDDASKAGMIVKALQAGLDGYLPTPPDEDRLFFEVERHLRHASGGGGATTGETLLTARPEFSDLQTQLADRESQLVELGMQNDLLQQEITKAREQAKLFGKVKGALIGVLEGELDEDQAVRLKERLAMATVLETEVDTLREELGGLRSVRRELQEQVDTLRRRVTEQEESDNSRNMDSLEGAALKDRAGELEADNMVMAGRVNELEEELELAKAELIAVEQKHKRELNEVQRELNRISSDQALSAGDVERGNLEHMETVARLNDDHKDSLVRLREEHEAQLQRAISDVEIEKATIEARIADAVSAKERELLGGAQANIAQLNDALQQASIEKDQAVERALDIELVLDELKTKIEFLEGEVGKAQDRAQRAEDAFKKDKIRLIEEKEVAAAGSQEAFSKVQKFIDENASLKRANAELAATRDALEARAVAGDQAVLTATMQMEQAAIIRAEAIQQRDTAEGAKRAVDDRCAALEQRIGSLEAALEVERGRVQAAERALADAGTAVNRLADANAARDALEKEAERLGEKLADAEGKLMRVSEELDTAHRTGAGSDDVVRDLQARSRGLEEALGQREASEREARDALTAVQGELDTQRKSLTEHYEQRLRDAAQGSPTATTDALAERDAYRQRLAETEAWVQQAQVHLEALRVERDQLAAQATALANDVQSRGSESQELYAQLSQAKQQVEAMAGRSAGLEEELGNTRQQLARAQQIAQAAQAALDNAEARTADTTQPIQAPGSDPALLQQAQDEVRALRHQLQAAQQQQMQAAALQQAAAGAGAGLPEELEPLRWTLTAAIDALTALEPREPAIATHLRNLRLLASTLQKLS